MVERSERVTLCPRCRQPLDRSTAMIKGVAVVACRKVCRLYAVELPAEWLIEQEWLPGGPDLIGRLVTSYEAARRTAEVRFSEASDPRWQEMVG